MTGEPRASSRTSSAAVLAAVLCLAFGVPAPAVAGPVEHLKDKLMGRHPAAGLDVATPPVARYVTEDGDVFTLDRTQPKPLLKFENSFEVWALQPQPAPRG